MGGREGLDEGGVVDVLPKNARSNHIAQSRLWNQQPVDHLPPGLASHSFISLDRACQATAVCELQQRRVPVSIADTRRRVWLGPESDASAWAACCSPGG